MKENIYPLGLVSISFRDHTPRQILEAMKNAGLFYVEWGSDVHAPFCDTERLHEIADMQKEYGIVCSSYGTYFRLGQTPLNELESYIAAAKILKTDILRLWCGTKSGADMTCEEKENLFAQCRQAAEIAKLHGVTLCMECHQKTFTERTEDSLELMHTIKSPNFLMYWQPNQFRTEEENIYSANILAPYTKIIHVFNWEGMEKYPLGDAIEIWKRYLSCFDDSQRLLLEFMPDGLLTTLERETEALRTIVGINE